MLEFEYIPLIWPFVVSLLITTMLGVYAYRRRHVPAVSIFGMLMLALSVWTFCYIMELSSATLQGKVFWDSVKYFGSASAPVLWFVLALHLTKNDHWLMPLVQGVISSRMPPPDRLPAGPAAPCRGRGYSGGTRSAPARTIAPTGSRRLAAFRQPAV